jgi:putative ABC transport system permease protein
MRNFIALHQTDLGFDPENLLVARVPLPREHYQTAAAKQRFFEALLPQLHALPGVVAATESSAMPVFGGTRTDIEIPGKTHIERWQALYQLCSEEYFRTLGLKLLHGRTLLPVDVQTTRKVALINETLARRYFPGESPVGRTITITQLQKLADASAIQPPTFEIVGVVSDSKNRGIIEPLMPEIFLPYTITAAHEQFIVIRTRTDPEILLNSVRQEVWKIDRGVAITWTGTLMEYVDRYYLKESRFSFALMSLFAAVGLTLVAVGVYSVIAYLISRQTREIGIRMALGARRADVIKMVTGVALRLVGTGACIGIVASLIATRVIDSQLSGVSRNDPMTFGAVLALIVFVGLLACYFPAQRAARVNPIVALRLD